MTDLTRDNPTKTLIKFALPMVLSVAFQQFYNMADKLIAGRYAGEQALAAVSASYPITMIIMAFALGTNIGCSVVISGLYGGKKFSEVKTAVTTSLTLALPNFHKFHLYLYNYQFQSHKHTHFFQQLHSVR